MKSNRSFSLDIEEARRRLEVWRKSRRVENGYPLRCGLWRRRWPALMESAPSRRGWAWITTDSNGGRRQSGRHDGRGLSPLLDSSNCPSLGSLATVRTARWNWRGVREPG